MRDPTRPRPAARSLFRFLGGLLPSMALLVVADGGPVSSEPPDPDRLWALVIGVSNYVHAEPLHYAAADARSFSEFVQSPRGGRVPPEHVFTLLEDQATRFEVLVALEAMQERVQPGDTVYVFVAGHGFVTERGLGYFIPSDGNLAVPAATSVSFTVLKELVDIGLAHAARRILVSDMCNAGRVGPQRTELAEKIQNLVNAELLKLGGSEGGSFLNFLASRPTEASWESDELGRGVFTHVLLEALNGRAALREDPIVLAEDVVRYVQMEVPKYTAFQQNPMVNEGYDPALPMAFLDRPGPEPRPVETETVLVILHADRAPFRRVQWLDPLTQAVAVRDLTSAPGALRIPSLRPGELELSFYDPQDEARRIRVSLAPGENRLDLLSPELGYYLFTPAREARSASRALTPVAVASLGAALQQPSVPAEPEAALLLRLEEGTEIYLDDRYFGRSLGDDRFLQLAGLEPGVQHLVLSTPEREHRFRLRLFPGPQILDLESGELRPVVQVQPPPAALPVPASLGPLQQELYRDFYGALWSEHLLAPEGSSAWDYYQRLGDQVSPELGEFLRNRLVVAMGNRAQRITLKYLRGGDVRWNARIFEEGAQLAERAQSLLRSSTGHEAQGYFFQGRARIERGDYDGASIDLRRAVELDPEASHAYNALGLALWKQNRLEEAQAPLRQAIALSPNWTYPRITLALIHLEQRRYAETEEIFRQAMELDPDDSTAYHGLGQLYFLLGRWEEAEEQLNRAIQVNPGNAYAHESWARLLGRLQQWEEAERLLRLAMRLEPAEPSFPVTLAEILRQSGRIEQAEPVYRQALDRFPGDPQVLLSYASYRAARNDPGEADRLFLQVLQLDPEEANHRVRYGLFLEERGRTDEAIREWRRAARISPSNPYAPYNLALALLKQGRTGEAEEELEKAMAADPRYAAPHALLGHLRFSQKRYDEALDSYRQALEYAIEAHQRQELQESIREVREVFLNELLEEASRLRGRGNHREAWQKYLSAAQVIPDHRGLRNALLEFHELHPEFVRPADLPPGLLREALGSRFWVSLLEAEELWGRDERERAPALFLSALSGIGEEELRLLGSTAFNLGNPHHSLHAIVHRWGLRCLEQRDYATARRLMEEAMRLNIFAQVPDLSPVTVDSLMRPADVERPRVFSDFEVAHHPDRRAHELLAATASARGEPSAARSWLEALETLRSDLGARTLVAGVFEREGQRETALEFLKEALAAPSPEVVEQDGYVEAVLLLSTLQCRGGDCRGAGETLEQARRRVSREPRLEEAWRNIGRCRCP